MKKLSLFAMLLGLGLFSVGCDSAAENNAEDRIDAAGQNAEAAQAVEENAAGNVDADTVDDKMEDAADANQDLRDGNADAALTPSVDGVAPAAPELTPAGAAPVDPSATPSAIDAAETESAEAAAKPADAK